jgi:hypothetical protein
MASAAVTLLRSFNGVETSSKFLAEKETKPTLAVESEVSFLAAIYNAHLGQSYDLIYYHCLRSIQASPAIAKAMSLFIDLQTRRAPTLMCTAAEKIAGLASQLIPHYLLRQYQRLDELLLDVMVDVLKQSGIDAHSRLNTMRIEEHSAARRPVDLLDPYYSKSSIQRVRWRWRFTRAKLAHTLVQRDYYRAYASESRFYFVGEADSALRLRLTCRLPPPQTTQREVCVVVNGSHMWHGLVRRQWLTIELEIAGRLVQDGVNEVMIGWPIPEFGSDVALEQAADDLEAGHFPDLYPVFGEIHSLTAFDGRQLLP